MLRTHDLNLLPIFDALIREESLTKAAEELGMSQPAVSNALKRLRLSLKDDLFVRTGRGLKPTQRAIELHRLFTPALDVIASGFHNQDFLPEDFDRTIDITMDAVVEYVSMPSFMQKARALAPKMKLRVHPNHLGNIPGRLKDGRLHYAIDYAEYPEEHFEHEVLTSDTLSVICAVDHPVLEDVITLEQYQTMPHVSLVSRKQPSALNANSDDTPVELVMGREAPARHIQLRVSNFFCIPAVVSETDLIAIVPSRFARPYEENGVLKILAAPFDYPEVEHRLYWHKSRSSDPSHEWLKTLILQLSEIFLDEATSTG